MFAAFVGLVPLPRIRPTFLEQNLASRVIEARRSGAHHSLPGDLSL